MPNQSASKPSLNVPPTKLSVTIRAQQLHE